MTDLQRFVFSFFNVEVMGRYLPSIVDGFVLTVYLALAVIATGVTVGLALAVLRSLQVRPVNWAIVFVVDLLRALPPLVVIVLFYFALPYVGVRMSGFVATWASLSLVLAAFAALPLTASGHAVFSPLYAILPETIVAKSGSWCSTSLPSGMM